MMDQPNLSLREDGPPAPAFTPVQVVCALLKSDVVYLSGFDAHAQMDAPAWVPLVQRPFPEDVGAAITETKGLRMRVLSIPLGALLLCATALAFTVGRLNFQPVSVASPIVWHVESVGSAGLSVMVGARAIQIPVGAVLPSGERLVSVDLPNQSYETPHQRVVLSKRELR